MKTVLLAVDHMTPNPKALDYAMNLCRRLLANLDVLHIVSPLRYSKSPESIASPGERVNENATKSSPFSDMALSEPEEVLKTKAYEQVRRMLPEKPAFSIEYHYIGTGEATDAVIERYVHDHHRIVLTVFDSDSRGGAFRDKKNAALQAGGRGMPKLAIPFVRVKNAS